MGLPPKPVRRVLLAPAVILVTVFAIGSLPLWLVGAAFASRYIPGRWRPLRLTWFLVVWLVFESLVLVALFVLWVASGFGWKCSSEGFQTAHYALMAWFMRRVVGSARFTFGIEAVTEDTEVADAQGHPLLVFARHAGPGDSLLLVHALLNRRERRPRIVLKDTLQWDPAIDTALNRLPNRFISTRSRPGEAAVEAIADLAAGMGPRDALIIFPEGGNYTPQRRTRAIEKLEAAGLDEYAERARAMEHLLPPKPRGVLTAIGNAPDSAIVLVGHAGLEGMTSVREIWSGIRMDITVYTRLWTYNVADLSEGEAELEAWLYDRWADMNSWLSTHLDDPGDRG